ncbi:MAG: glutaredoxin-like protein [bacterium]|nr:MAG: glutaredoxin-like protein [bacterium]KAF0149800.1 MAG: glutaredoxin-like protein [bacterium]KAF0168501.1 MAG: glutaredoxin-like protein [bacterium]TXT19566.1 MAG: glutaredoxin-like protein [bacterium]
MRLGFRLSVPILFVLVAMGAHASGVYKWVDPGGRTHYSDQPPPADTRGAQQIRGKGNVVEVDKESYAGKQAHAKNPVVLYANNCGPFCDQAREHLKRRGVAYSQKDPSTDPEQALALKKLVGAMEVPVIVVGKSHLKGYETTSWDKLLDEAGYPKTPLIPPPPEPARKP